MLARSHAPAARTPRSCSHDRTRPSPARGARTRRSCSRDRRHSADIAQADTSRRPRARRYTSGALNIIQSRMRFFWYPDRILRGSARLPRAWQIFALFTNCESARHASWRPSRGAVRRNREAHRRKDRPWRAQNVHPAFPRERAHATRRVHRERCSLAPEACATEVAHQLRHEQPGRRSGPAHDQGGDADRAILVRRRPAAG